MIVREAMQSHKKAIEEYVKVDKAVQDKLDDSWKQFTAEIPFIKTMKMF